jgi:hypothetical protein
VCVCVCVCGVCVVTATSFWRLYGTIKNFKMNVRERFPSALPPAVVKTSDTLRNVLTTFNEQKKHRVFIVNAVNVPIRVCTQRDILAACLTQTM